MDCPALNAPHLQYFPTHSRRRKASVSFLFVREVTISTQQRYLISFQSDVQHLKPTDTSSPFQSPFSKHVLVHYKPCNYSSLAERLSIHFMLKSLSYMHSCTLTHAHTHIIREVRGVWKSHFLLTLGDLLTRLLLPGCKINTIKHQAVAVSSSS